MENIDVVSISNQLLLTSLLLVTPTVAASLAVGLLISIFQAITSIQEQTLSFAPRIVAVGLVISLTLAWSLELAVDFTRQMFLKISEYSSMY